MPTSKTKTMLNFRSTKIQMPELLKYFLRVRRSLLLLLILAFVTYISIEFIFNNYTEIFKGANKIGQLFSKLSVSYISAFIFYFIVVHIKSESDKENVNEFIGQLVNDILTSAHLFVLPFVRIEKKDAHFKDVKTGELRTLLPKIQRMAHEAPYSINGKTTHWLDWWEYLKKSTFESIDEIFLRYNHVDTKLIKIITRIKHSSFFKQWNMLYTNEYDKTFGLYSEQIIMFLTHIHDLQEYADKYLDDYKHRTSQFMGYNRKKRN